MQRSPVKPGPETLVRERVAITARTEVPSEANSADRAGSEKPIPGIGITVLSVAAAFLWPEPTPCLASPEVPVPGVACRFVAG